MSKCFAPLPEKVCELDQFNGNSQSLCLSGSNLIVKQKSITNSRNYFFVQIKQYEMQLSKREQKENEEG